MAPHTKCQRMDPRGGVGRGRAAEALQECETDSKKPPLALRNVFAPATWRVMGKMTGAVELSEGVG